MLRRLQALNTYCFTSLHPVKVKAETGPNRHFRPWGRTSSGTPWARPDECAVQRRDFIPIWSVCRRLSRCADHGGPQTRHQTGPVRASKCEIRVCRRHTDFRRKRPKSPFRPMARTSSGTPWVRPDKCAVRQASYIPYWRACRRWSRCADHSGHAMFQDMGPVQTLKSEQNRAKSVQNRSRNMELYINIIKEIKRLVA